MHPTPQAPAATAPQQAPQPSARGSVPAAVAALDLHYTRPVAVLHEIDGDGHTLLVFGDPEYAAYEWAAVRDGVVVSHSNCGYGSPAPALRDALIVTIGEPAHPPRFVSAGTVPSEASPRGRSYAELKRQTAEAHAAVLREKAARTACPLKRQLLVEEANLACPAPARSACPPATSL